jgi:hypothetical protein
MSEVELTTNAREVAVDLGRLGDEAIDKGRAVVRTFSALAATKVQAHASGRPGPNAPTGDYRRSITSQVTDGPGGITGLIGTNEPQGWRLELGFVGEDSKGRHYNQPPYAHFGPAMDEIEEPFVEALTHIAEGDK